METKKSINGYKKITFGDHRVTYRNDAKDINLYIHRNDMDEYHDKDSHRVYATGKGDKHISMIGENLSLVNAEKKALEWIKKH